MKTDKLAEVKWVCSELISQGLKQTPANLKPPKWDEQKLYDLTVEHQLAPVLGARLSESEEISANCLKTWRVEYQRSAREALHRMGGFQRIMRALEEGPEFIVLKGWALMDELYRDVAERPCRELDLWFRNREDAQAAADHLEAVGYRMTGTTPPDHHHLPAMSHPEELLSVVLHVAWGPSPMPDSATEEIWKRKIRYQCGGSLLWRLDPVSALGHACVHALNDPLGSPFLRNLYEIAYLAKRVRPVHYDRMRTLFYDWGIDAKAARLLNLAHRMFDTPAILIDRPGGFYEIWCNYRLKHASPDTKFQLFLFALGGKHVDMMNRGRDHRNPFWILWLVTSGALQLICSKLWQRFRPRWGRIRRSDFPSVEIGQAELIHHPHTGEAHLLHGEAWEIWKACEKSIRVKRLIRTPEDKQRVLPLVEALRSKGLLT